MSGFGNMGLFIGALGATQMKPEKKDTAPPPPEAPKYAPDDWRASLPEWKIKIGPDFRKDIARFEKDKQDVSVALLLCTKKPFARPSMKRPEQRALMETFLQAGLRNLLPVHGNLLYGETTLSKLQGLAELKDVVFVEKREKVHPLAVMGLMPNRDFADFVKIFKP
jgi:hypothetical protein